VTKHPHGPPMTLGNMREHGMGTNLPRVATESGAGRGGSYISAQL